MRFEISLEPFGYPSQRFKKSQAQIAGNVWPKRWQITHWSIIPNGWSGQCDGLWGFQGTIQLPLTKLLAR
ncbi:hypothetical protein SVA_1467 [Sulfurifustis variabilis]|uniref:Uncharacterized protein n=1 Tax=Sulfurifustis variabilis TaxID=1675686 RepID=A0A1B4V393_9GAMM|nr:hypothetical protein SVA_1467 [Sulfurifustis variabilis]